MLAYSEQSESTPKFSGENGLSKGNLVPNLDIYLHAQVVRYFSQVCHLKSRAELILVSCKTELIRRKEE